MKRNKIISKKTVALFEVALMIIAIFAFSLAINESSSLVNNSNANNNLSNIIKNSIGLIGRLIFGEKGIVSARDDTNTYTCLLSNNGAICQTYNSADDCQNNCAGTCINAPSSVVSECVTGTCFDPASGTCALGSTKDACTDKNGNWYNDPNGNIPICQKGCCILGDQTQFTTQKACAISASSLGVTENFTANMDELNCYLQAYVQEEAACVIPSGSSNSCQFTTEGNCLKLGGTPYPNYLCSAPQLNTTCEPEQTTGCVNGKDEIYWFDSCGNIENIYAGSSQAQKQQSWNNGKILAKSGSCSLGDSGNQFANQGTCGNCDRLQGSVCGTKTTTQKLNDTNQNVVCKKLTCVDENGNARQNGESWCRYQGARGIDYGTGNLSRSVAPVGSRDFTETCADGNIETEPCADFKSQICVQNGTKLTSGKTFSSAACRANDWNSCLSYNSVITSNAKNKENKNSMKIQTKQRNDLCNNNMNCFLKQVNLGKDFNFTVCAPKYPAGFDVSQSQNEINVGNQTTESQKICNIASQNCTVILADGAPVVNQQCLTNKFTEQMNDLCISVGDCGAKINYAGIITQNFQILRNKKKVTKASLLLSTTYLSGLLKYIKPVNYYYIKPGKYSNKTIKNIKNESGYGGILLASGNNTGILASAASSIDSNNLSGYGNASFVLKPGYTSDSSLLLAGGGVFFVNPLAGAIIMFGYLTGILGEDITTVKVRFLCQPWEPPVGGAYCNKCGQDGFPCSQYACQSLGATCNLINADSSQPACINSDPNDVTPPVISPLLSAMGTGEQYSNVNDNGFDVTATNGNGCFTAYSQLSFGISTNKPSQCKMEANHTSSYEDMETDFDLSGFYLNNHTMNFTVPSLESLGVNSINPNASKNFNLYIRCQDYNENNNTQEYNINFCIKPQKDTISPKILSQIPELGLVPANATDQVVALYMSEPADCRWDDDNNVQYVDMKNNFDCSNSIDEETPNGWACSYDFPVNTNGSSYHVRCLDQPWIAGINDSQRNEGDDYLITLNKTAPLNISSVSPTNETIISGTEFVTLNLTVQTTGGVDGTATCYYGLADNNGGIDYFQFFDTGGTDHLQPGLSFGSGDYSLPIMCIDSIGNSALVNASFNVQVDNTAPLITRVYNSDGKLNIVTNENSTCSFVNSIARNVSLCNFDFENGTIMDGSDITHTTMFYLNQIYYIKCNDTFGNINSGCGILIKPVDLTAQE